MDVAVCCNESPLLSADDDDEGPDLDEKSEIMAYLIAAVLDGVSDDVLGGLGVRHQQILRELDVHRSARVVVELDLGQLLLKCSPLLPEDCWTEDQGRSFFCHEKSKSEVIRIVEGKPSLWDCTSDVPRRSSGTAGPSWRSGPRTAPPCRTGRSGPSMVSINRSVINQY